MISLIAAMSLNRVIGDSNTLPWHLPNDLNRFREVTMGKIIVMGRKTWESLPGPLKGRINVVVTRNKTFEDFPNEIVVFNDVQSVIDLSESTTDEIVIIGGEQIYRQMLPHANFIYLTVIDEMIKGDAYFPSIDLRYWSELSKEINQQDESNFYDHTFYKYGRKL